MPGTCTQCGDGEYSFEGADCALCSADDPNSEPNYDKSGCVFVKKDFKQE